MFTAGTMQSRCQYMNFFCCRWEASGNATWQQKCGGLFSPHCIAPLYVRMRVFVLVDSDRCDCRHSLCSDSSKDCQMMRFIATLHMWHTQASSFSVNSSDYPSWLQFMYWISIRCILSQTWLSPSSGRPWAICLSLQAECNTSKCFTMSLFYK
jgi:hypothetical protein